MGTSDLPRRLHSKYNPQKEASRYIESLDISFKPRFVVVTEPGESFLASVIRSVYPDSKIIAIRYQDEYFEESDNLWDAVWRPLSGGDVGTFLFNLIPDELIPLTLFLPWKPSDTFWPEKAEMVWHSIASLFRLQKSIMYTRTHFGKRWFSNMIANSLSFRTILQPVYTRKPVLLAAAGPSLEKILPTDRELRENIFLCAVSSAVSCLAAHNCVPDLCIATDGGYWAKMLFQNLAETVPVAIPMDAAVPSGLCDRNPILPLSYGSHLESKLFDLCGITPEKAVRNGSVAGTAALYALSHTCSNVYAAGLDLSVSDSFSHARPHPSDVLYETTSDRFSPLQTKLTGDNFQNLSLGMYADWFSSRKQDFKERFFRLNPSGTVLRGIQSATTGDIPHMADKTEKDKSLTFQSILSEPERKEKIAGWLSGLCDSLESETDAIFHEPVFPEIFQLVSYTDYIQLLKKEREPTGAAEYTVLYASLAKKTVSFLRKLKERTGYK
ncbi:DUF115 domain-containing protein [Brucepastera parasyntrophica]|uniref:6-hydroxymethylpterin diphosphokinase MptE-like protein n=1 Tax=Brucepastera parasyntrophica TaxID=2880008 RepID=UPI00210DBE61|nr:6-hydroxymethylpterin diphosphokinase MptE-like protein [Brucepastera parasyntrophica]ULQ60008.1 DUF115 domain-containing protein [Brucepastera parasyntrophica]